jgi:hypothetical protein
MYMKKDNVRACLTTLRRVVAHSTPFQRNLHLSTPLNLLYTDVCP